MLNVLVVEDEDFMHEILDSYLNKFGKRNDLNVNITARHDAVQGMFEATIHGEQYDLILLDVRLPRLSGDRIYASLLDQKPDIARKILFITSFRPDLEDRFAGKRLAILDKPFSYSGFENTLSSMLAAA